MELTAAPPLGLPSRRHAAASSPSQDGLPHPGRVPAPSPLAVTADLLPHPLTTEGRVVRPVPVRPGMTLAALVHAEWPGSLTVPIEAVIDGRPVPRAAWDGTRLAGGEIVTVRAGVRGGGDSNPLQVIAIIAVIAVSFYVPGAAGLTAGTWQFAATQAAFMVAGTLVVNALVPPRLPDAAGTPDAPSAAYSLTAGSNRARPYEPMLLVLGEHRVFPDLGMREHTAFEGGEQYLSTVLHFGLGDPEIGPLFIGDTPIGNFDDVETERAGPDGRIALVAGNVDTEPGAELEDTEWTERRTPPGTTRIGLDFLGRVFGVNDDGDYYRRSVQLQVELRSGAHRLRRDFTMSNGNADQVRRTRSHDLPAAGVWTVRVRRTSAPSDSSRKFDDVAWAALRSYQPDAADYAGQNRLAVRIRASGQLSGRLDRVSATVRQKVPVWDGQRWTEPRATSNPAWIYRWLALGIRVGGRLVAGAGLAASRVDDDGIKAWGAWCEGQGLRCDYALQSAMSIAELLALVAQCGRASPSWSSGRLGVVWEDRDRAATALITPGNVLAGTFEVDYAAGKVAEEIACRFVDPDADWQWSTVRRTMPGVDVPASTATLTLRGVTTRRQAAIECNLAAARQAYHRRRLRWSMGPEALTSIHRGDVVRITHGLIDGGAAGRLRRLSSSRADLDLGREVSFDGANDHILLALPDGSLHSSRAFHPDGRGVAGSSSSAVLLDPVPAPPAGDPEWSAEDIRWRAYASQSPPAKARVVSIEPQADRTVRVEAVDEVDAYHDAATSNLSVPLPDSRRRTGRVVRADFSETLIRAGSGHAVELRLALTVEGDWREATVRASQDGEPERTVARLTGGGVETAWLVRDRGPVRVTVIPGSEAAPLGGHFTATYEVQGFLVPPSAPRGFFVDVLADGTRRFRWAPPDDPDLAGIEIRYAADANAAIPWAEMMPMHDGILTSTPWETIEPAAGRWVFAARARDTGGRVSETDIRIVAALGGQRFGDALIWRCPTADGWPGTVTGGAAVAGGAIEAEGTYTWSDLSTWEDWRSWGLGNGTGGGTALAYATEPIDLGAVLSFTPSWTAETTGEAAFEYRTGADRAALEAASWTAYERSARIEARWIQLRWRLTGDGTDLLRMDRLCWSLLAPITERKILDRDTATLSGSAATGRILPVDLAVVTDVHLTLQSVGGGWTWEVTSKAPPTIRIYDGEGNPADAVVDAVVRGAAA